MKFACIILLHALICWFFKMTIASQCKAASYSVQDHVLINHVIKTGPAELIEHCISRCIEHTGCHSSNFYRISKWCELNDKTHASHPEDMRQVPFTNYMENTLRPPTCNKDSDCGSSLFCFLSKCEGELGDYFILLCFVLPQYVKEKLSNFTATRLAQLDKSCSAKRKTAGSNLGRTSTQGVLKMTEKKLLPLQDG